MKSIFTFCFALTFIALSYAQPGTLDNSFSTDGKVTTKVLAGGNGAFDVVLQPDGKILVGGSAYNGATQDFALARYKTIGTLDNSFDNDGIATLNFGLPGDNNLSDLALQADGKILAVGTIDGPIVENMAIARFNSDGSPDFSFGTDGKMVLSLQHGNAIAVQPNGKILVAGCILVNDKYDFAVLRLDSDGSMDTSFGINGQVITEVSDKDDHAQTILLQPDNKIIVTGKGFLSGENCFAVVRYLDNGNPDHSFLTDGIVKVKGGEGGKGILQPDGKIIVSGVINNADGFPDFGLLRLNSDGTTDNSFGTNGKVTTAFGISNTNDFPTSLALQADGKLIQAGYSNIDVWDFSMARFNVDGSPDYTFGDAGKVITAFEVGSDDECRAAAIQEDGKIVLAGRYMKNSKSNFAVARYLAGCPLPFAVTVSEITDTKATVSWTGNDDAASYRIRKRAAGTETWIYSSVTAPTTSKQLSNNIPATQYEVQVQSYCNVEKTDSSGYTNAVLFTSAGTCEGTNSQSTNGITNSSAQLNWTFDTAPNKWTIKYHQSGSAWITVKVSGNATSCNLTALASSASYNWKIRAKCGSENSVWSPTQHFTTSPARLADVKEITGFTMYPNPANQLVTLQFLLQSSYKMNIRLYDVSGKEMITWFDGEMAEGEHTLSFDVSSFVNGIYFVRIITESGIQNQKLIVQ